MVVLVTNKCYGIWIFSDFCVKTINKYDTKIGIFHLYIYNAVNCIISYPGIPMGYTPLDTICAVDVGPVVGRILSDPR